MPSFLRSGIHFLGGLIALVALCDPVARADEVDPIEETDQGATGNPGQPGGNVSATLAEEDWIDSTTSFEPAIEASSTGGAGDDGGTHPILGYGDTGGTGGVGGTVTVTSDGTLTTHGLNSPGISARSAGGNAGAGGFGIVTSGYGGAGGIGGAGNQVTVTARGAITTFGAAAAAIQAISRGGTGGDGGTGGGVAGVGGGGDRGGHAGTVGVTNYGSLMTNSVDAPGINAQGIGGNGGHGGVGAGLGGVAGSGADGGSGSSVTVTNYGTVWVLGGSAAGTHGIFARSAGGNAGDGAVGGGGGGVGGAGGHGGNAARAEITNHGLVLTNGVNAHALFAHSDGGGGGDAGTGGGGGGVGRAGGNGGDGGAAVITNYGIISTQLAGANGIRAMSSGDDAGDGAVGGGVGGVGGTGGVGGDGGLAVVTNHGVVTTQGASAHGLTSLSIGNAGGSGGSAGGGGGNGGVGERGGHAGAVGVTNNAQVTTNGAGALGIYARSEAGDGGRGGDGNGGLGVGGDGGRGGASGTVEVNNSGIITTDGEDAHGIAASSLGGAGGDGGSGFGFVGNGGEAAGSGPANLVDVDNFGDITTEGNGARGIFAESIGGHVGTGGAATGLFSYGGNAHSSGAGGNVLIESHGTVTTHGENAEGIFAESIGGGGGSGGVSVGLLNTIGGSGSASGNGGSIDVDNYGAISTEKFGAHGIFAHSVGGGGGNAGGSASLSAWIGTSIGGIGDSGGSGGRVDVTTGESTITTSGERAYGIFANSVGGGGGFGGWSIALSGGVGGGSVSWSSGGWGAGGGDGNVVWIENGSSIHTSGSDSHGIYAVSRGGGGGDGGFSISGAGADGVGLAFSTGGFAGGGGDGAEVHVENNGALIETNNMRANAIYAQSVGGGGGNGGFSIAGAGGGAGGGTFNLGGKGGAGGHGSIVFVQNAGDLFTHVDDSTALFAQSLGGGGGNGGFSISAAGGGVGAGTINIGGFGDNGGNGAGVTVMNLDSLIETFGARSKGIEALSQGGGGGNGGFSITGAGAGTGSGTMNLGGKGDGGGHGSTVHVDSRGRIVTHGEDALAIFAQSLGGGGGNGGFSIAGSGAGTGSGALSIGGFSGGGGNADAVEVIHSGAMIETHGARATAISAQSQGGGGGNGGFNISGSGAGTGSGSASLGGSGGLGGNGSTVTVDNQGSIVTHGDDALGVFAQSLGGGGGNGGFNISGSGAGTGSGSLSVGGSSEGGGDAGVVDVTSTGALIETFGLRADAVTAQSQGGGGGNGGFNISANGTLYGGGLGVGGLGGDGGNGDGVSVDNASNILTHANESRGIFAQSIGGGGGNGGFNITGALSTGLGGGVSVGGAGGGGGGSIRSDSEDTRSTVVVEHSGSIETWGEKSTGIDAQSVGGGGGNGGFSVNAGVSLATAYTIDSVGLSVGGCLNIGPLEQCEGGDGGTVTVNSSGSIITHGAESYGIHAESEGGGGGNGGWSIKAGLPLSGSLAASVGGFGGGGGNGQAVTIDTGEDSLVRTEGENSAAIHARSVGGGGGKGNFSVSGLLSLPGDVKEASLNLGGFGGDGGHAGNVTVDASGAIETVGAYSNGIHAMSTGGGGGEGGASFSGAISLLPPDGQDTSVKLAVAVGGKGGHGGDAGDEVRVDMAEGSRISTEGFQSSGIFAQSVGGGGGVGGLSVAAIFDVAPAHSGAKTVDINVAVGGFGGDGGLGKSVTVVSGADIGTSSHSAHGIYAQSIGGGGGDAGGAIAGGMLVRTNTPDKKFNGNFTMGGFGGTGNVGGTVTVQNQGSITTLGNGAHGVFAQSIGGGGGNGGNANSVSFALGLSCQLPLGDLTCPSWWKQNGDKIKPVYNGNVAVGGWGGSGNDGGIVTVSNAGSITINGMTSAGILAQSIGHGGGNGGNANTDLSGAVPTPAGQAVVDFIAGAEGYLIDNGEGWSKVDLSATVGGGGGGSGSGGAVVVFNSGDITSNTLDKPLIVTIPILGGVELYLGTRRASAPAILAQSIGGGGGNGGLAASGTTGLVSVGGFGGSSGDGGAVTVTNDGVLTTLGGQSHGIHVQSIGGGGGLSEAYEINPESNGSGGPCGGIICVGGWGGAQGDGGVVTVTNNGHIHTSGYAARGIYSQSIGGGGGASSGGSDKGGLGFAGTGGAGGAGGAVTILNNEHIRTDGEFAQAIFVESVGGGGGSFAGSTALIGIGGRQGSSGDGGSIVVENHGRLTTTGSESSAIDALSIGGGGGDQYAAAGTEIPVAESFIGIGGKAGASGTGGAVTVDNWEDGVIVTHGAGSHGISAQSIGGGGGSSSLKGSWIDILSIGADGATGGNGGVVTVHNRGAITTMGTGSDGIVARSVGGGGGDGSTSHTSEFLPFAYAIGGKGGSGGEGGAVSVENTGDATITVLGANSTGIFAQSVGGGGGSGGSATSQLAVVDITVGGSGTGGGNGGTVTATNGAFIELTGNNSIGILAQSIGGGGGTARNEVTNPLNFFSTSTLIGGSDGTAGAGGDVTVTNSGTIVITGNNSVGLFAQSVGGGGGLAQIDGGASQLELLDGGVGNGGVQNIVNTGSIRIFGRGSVAMLTQSVGGGGGTMLANAADQSSRFTGSSGGRGIASDVVLDQTGDLVASGEDSVALLAQSDASDGRGNITVNILNRSTETPSVIAGGGGNGAGVMLLGGTNNALNNAGIITSTPGIDGLAIFGDVGNNAVNNTGVVFGSVNLGAGTGSFLNSAGAAFVSGGTVNLGGGEFNNAGWLSPGDTGRVLTTQLAGSFTQQDSGTFAVDLDIQQTAVAADRIEVSGNAQFSGNVVLNVLNTGYAMPGDHVATILSAGGNVTHADSALQAPQSAVATYELRYPDAHRIEIAYGIDFAARGALNRNQTSIGEAINALQSAGGSSSFSSLATDLIGLTDAAALASAYDSLSPEIYVGNETGAIFSSLSFSDSMMSCRAAGGQFQFAREEECRWIRLGQDDLRQDGTEENFEFNRTSYNLAGGAQWETGDSWHLGFALGLSLDNLDVGDLSSSEGKQYQAGLSAKWRHENTTLSATLSGGYADYETLRTNDLPGAGGIVTSNPRMNLAASHLRLGHVLDYGSWYLRPLVDAGVSYVDTAAFSEQGSSGGTLEVKSGSGTVWTVQPEIELGAEHAFASGSTLRSYLRFGLLHWLSGTTPDVEAAFRGAPDDVDPFIVSGSTDRNFGSVTLGLSLMREKNFELRLDYSGRFSDNTSYQGAGLKFASRF